MNHLKRTLIQLLATVILLGCMARSQTQGAKLQLSSLDKLAEKAARSTDVTLDGSMLSFAVNLIDKINDEDDKDVVQLKSIISKLKGIYVKSFEFDEASQYTKADVESIRSQLSPNWTKIVQSVDKRHNEHDEIYLLKDGNHVAGVLILVAEARELTVVNIVGDVPVDKIASLESHFSVTRRDNSKNDHKKKGESHDEE